MDRVDRMRGETEETGQRGVLDRRRGVEKEQKFLSDRIFRFENGEERLKALRSRNSIVYSIELKKKGGGWV